MKSLLLLCIAICCTTAPVKADSPATYADPLKQMYVEVGVSVPYNYKYTGFMAEIGIPFLLHNNWGGAINFRGGNFKANNIPADYDAGGLFSGNATIVKSWIGALSIMGSRMVHIEGSHVKLLFSAGPSYISYQVHNFIPNTSYSPGWGSLLFGPGNYTDNITNRHTVGATMQIALHLPVSNSVGFNVNIYNMLYDNGIITGAGVNFLFGHLRDKKGHQ